MVRQAVAALSKVSILMVVSLIRVYQYAISPLLGPRCRFYPSCSQYAIDAVRMHGMMRGSYLAIKRLCRCHPGCAGGHDPVKERK